MAKDHPGPRPAHHGADTLPHIRAVAMDRARGAYRLGFPEGARGKPSRRIIEEFPALRARRAVPFPVVSAAIQADHGFHGRAFALDAGLPLARS